MRKSSKVLIAILVGTLMMGSLTGCGDGITKSSVKLSKGDIKDNSIVITVGDNGVKYSEVKNYCYFLKMQYEGSFGDQIWSYKTGEDTTVGDEAKEEVINMITQLKIINEAAKEQKVTLTNDEKDEAVQKAEEMIGTASAEDKEEYFLSVQSLSNIYEENAIANKMFYIATDDADTDISDEEAKQIKIQYLQVMTNGTNRSGMQVALNDKEKATALKRAQQLYAEVAQAADFLTFAKNNTDAVDTELTIGKDSTKMDSAAVTAAFALQKDQMSELVEGESGYYIIKCVENEDADDTQARKEEIIADRQTKMFKKKYANWLKDYDVNISEAFWSALQI